MKKWKIHQNIFFTKGYNRTLVFDSLFGSIKFIPNDLYDFILAKNFIFKEEEIEIEYFQLLKDNNYIFSDTLKNLKRFSKLSNDFSINFDFGVCVIELSDITGRNLYKLIESNNDYTRINQFNFIFGIFTTENSILKLIDFINQYEVDLVELTLIDGFKYVDFLFLQLNDKNLMFVVNNFLEKSFDFSNSQHKNRTMSSLDVKSLKIFANLYSYFESSFFNLYFYNKIYINHDSEIKNSNNTIYVYGSLEENDGINTKDILQNKEFTKYWFSKKEDTLVCNDCEFRNLCSDNRLPIFGNNLWFHDNECEYNPYISKWDVEKGYLNLENSGIILSKDNIIINKEILDGINAKLWD